MEESVEDRRDEGLGFMMVVDLKGLEREGFRVGESRRGDVEGGGGGEKGEWKGGKRDKVEGEGSNLR